MTRPHPTGHRQTSRYREPEQLAVAVSAEDLAIRDDDMRPDIVAGETADTGQLAIGFVGRCGGLRQNQITSSAPDDEFLIGRDDH
jgi:hypothetical protein